MLNDLEAKSMVRTAVETLNLSISGTHPDISKAECIRTFPTITFPAAELLRRGEVETQRAKGISVIVAIHASKNSAHLMWAAAPFDLMYGFRGSEHCVDLLSGFERVRCWGLDTAKLQAVIHYAALNSPDRILFPVLHVLRGLRHKWCWKMRPRPYVPIWSFCKHAKIYIAS